MHMTTFTLSFLVFLAAIAGLATGVLFGGRRIQGSCGGLGSIPGVESDCGGVCRSQGPEHCPHRRKQQARQANRQVQGL